MSSMLLLLALLQETEAKVRPETMLPADAVVYAALENVPRDLEWAKAILKSACRDGEDAKLFDWMMKQYEGEADEKFLRILGPLLTIRSVHLAARDVAAPATAQMIAIAVSDEPGELEMLIPEGTPSEKRHGAVVYALKPFHVAFRGEFVIAATDVSLIDAALKPDGPGLAGHPRFKALGDGHGDAPSLRGFVEVGEILRQARAAMSRRGRHEFDGIDAVLGFTQIRGARIDAWIDGGRMRARVEADADEGCAIWDLVRMGSGNLSSLGFVPNDAVYAVGAALEDVPAWLERVKRAMNDTYRNMGGDEAHEAWDEVADVAKRGFNLDLDEAAAAFGPNLTHFAWIAEGKARDFERRGEGAVFVMKIDKPDAVGALLDAAPDGQAFSDGLVVDEIDGVTVYSVDAEPSPAYAVMDEHLIVSLGLDALKRTIEARRKGETMAAPKEAMSKRAILNVRELCRVLAEQGFPAKFAGALRPDALEVGMIAETDRGLTLGVEGPGVGVGAVVGLLGAAIDTVMRRRRYASAEVAQRPATGDPAFKPEEGFSVPEDAGERDALIDRCLAGLGDEQIEAREAATTRLWQIGKPAVEKLAATYKTTDDP